jgi:hypothetical protein
LGCFLWLGWEGDGLGRTSIYGPRATKLNNLNNSHGFLRRATSITFKITMWERLMTSSSCALLNSSIPSRCNGITFWNLNSFKPSLSRIQWDGRGSTMSRSPFPFCIYIIAQKRWYERMDMAWGTMIPRRWGVLLHARMDRCIFYSCLNCANNPLRKFSDWSGNSGTFGPSLHLIALPSTFRTNLNTKDWCCCRYEWAFSDESCWVWRRSWINDYTKVELE